jgi:hypothetical protein
VSSRSHTEGESEDHQESSSREFSNPNRCHAVTYFFYQINKTQIVKFKIVAIQRRVIDPAADTRVSNNPFVSDGGVTAIPNSILATDANRLKVEQTARESVLANQQGNSATGINRDAAGVNLRAASLDTAAQAIPAAQKARALQQVDQALLKEGLIDKRGAVSETLVTELSFERISSLPTPGLLVKGCLDDCDTCEPALEKAIELELEHKRLQNELLKKQIELLEKSQEYRCCPADEEESATS